MVNDPVHVRNAPEKLFVTHFPDLMPPTLITSDKAEVLAFRAEYKDIIVKPLFGNGGAGVFHLKPDDENLGSLLEMFTQLYREPVIVQKYLPEIREGDKRIILIDGEAGGAVSRIPVSGEARANFHAGGSARKTVLTSRERDICAAIGPTLREKGLVFVGIDVIGDYLTEINVTSPTGIQEINQLDGVQLEVSLWDAMERRYHEQHTGQARLNGLVPRRLILADEGGVFVGEGGDRRIVQALAMLRRGKAGVGADPAVGEPAAVVAGVVEHAAGCSRRLQRRRLDVVRV